MASDLGVIVKLRADTSQYTAEFGQAKQLAQSLAATLQASGSQTAAGLTTATTAAQSLATATAAGAQQASSGLSQAGATAQALGNTLKATGTQASEAAAGLEGLTKSSRETSQSQQQSRTAGESFIAMLRDQVAVAGKSTEELLRYRAAQAGVATEAAPLILQLQNQKAAQFAAADAAQKEEAAQREAAASKRSAQAAADSFVQGLRDQAATQGLSATELLRYRAAQLGVSESAAPYLRALDEANKANGRGVISAGQHAAAMRMLPAQMTDVVTSIASGMPIWMVAIQQGGQIKDSFGGAGNAARAMLGSITPLAAGLGVLAVGIGATVAAYYQGSAEADRYRQSIVLSGNAAAVTVEQLSRMAREVDKITGTQAAAAAGLALMARSNKIGSDSFVEFTAMAVAMKDSAGKAVADTVKELEELGKKPADASAKLNEQYNYLTPTIYRQIKALEDQGKTEEAAALAQKTYSSAMSERAKQLDSELGYVERGWKAAKDAAADAWDKFLNVGRPTTVADKADEQIKFLEAEIKRRKEQNASLNIKDGKATADLEKQLENAKGLSQVSISAGKAIAEAVDKENKARQTGIDLQREAASHATKAEKRARELAEAEGKYGEHAKTSAQARLEYERLIAGIKEKYKDPKSSTAGQVSITDTQLAGLRSQLQAAELYGQQLRTLGTAASEMNAGERESLKLAEQIKLTTNAKTRAKLEQAKAEADALGVQLRSNDGLEKSLKSHQALIDANNKDATSIEARAREQEAANTVIGKGRTAIEQMTLATLEHQMSEAQGSDRFDPAYIAGLERKIAAQKRYVDALGQADYKAVIAHADELLRNANELSRVYDDELALSGLTGLEREKIVAQRAVELKYAKEIAAIDKSSLTDAEKLRAKEKVYQAQRIESAAAVAKTTQSYNARNSEEINRTLTDALMRGFESGKGFAENLADTTENLFRTMLLRPTISAVMAPVSGVINGVVQSGLNAIGLGSGNSLLSTAGNASSIYSLATGNSVLGQAANWLGLGGAAATAAGTATGIAATTGAGYTVAQGAIGLGLKGGIGATGSMIGGGGLGLVPGSAATTAIGGSVGTGLASATGAGAASGGLTGALSAIPGWGWALAGGALLLSQLDFGSRGANHSGAAASSLGIGNTAAAKKLMGDSRGDWYTDLTDRYNADVEKQLTGTVKALATVYEELAGKQIELVGGYAANGKHGDEGAVGYGQIWDKNTQQYLGGFTNRDLGTDPTKAWAAYVGEMGGLIVDQLKAADIPGWMRAQLDAIGDNVTVESLSAALQQINAAQAAIKQFGLAMPQFAGQADAARTALVSAFGGSETFTAQLSSFYGNFFTEAERTAVATQQVTEELGKLGYSMPTSREEYRKWVTAAIDAGESGAKSAAGLLKLESAVAGLTKTTDDVSKAALQAQQEASKAAASLRSNLIGLESKFSGAGFSRAYQVEDAAASVSALFASVGIDKGVGELAAKIQSATSADVEQYFREMWSVLPTTEARQQLVDVTTALLGMTSAAGSLAEAATSSTRSFGEAAAAALSARTSAGSLLDRINGELGGDGTAYALKREQELWAGLATASYAQQIDLAGQLTESVLGRMQLEKESAEKLSSIHRSLRDSIEATRIGALSPLTLGQQLKEAGDQFNAAVAKAKGGDTEAASQVAGLRQSYLALAQRYYAASDDYTAVFQSSEDAVRGLAGQMQTDAERQLSASQSTVSELQRLRDVAQSAYQQADRDYVASSAAAQAQATLLASMDGGITSLGEILQGLPAELAAQLQPLLGAGNDAALIATMRAAQDARPELMLSGLQQQALAGGASATQVARVSSQLYSDADVAALLQAGRANYPTWSMEQLAALGQSQYGIGREQLDRVIDGSHANGLAYVPFDGYLAELHRGETVVPARQAEIFRSLDFSQFGRGFEAIVQQLQSVQAELSQARSENAQLMAMLAGVMESTGNSTGQQLRQAVREVALAGVKPR